MTFYPRDTAPILPWCLRRGACPEVNATEDDNVDTLCQAGYICPTTGVKVPCPIGHFCKAGVQHPTVCSSDWFATADDRCPEGCESQPTMWSGLLTAVLLILGPLIACFELLNACFQQRRREESDKNQAALSGILDYISQQTVRLGRHPDERAGAPNRIQSRKSQAALASSSHSSTSSIGRQPTRIERIINRVRGKKTNSSALRELRRMQSWYGHGKRPPASLAKTTSGGQDGSQGGGGQPSLPGSASGNSINFSSEQSNGSDKSSDSFRTEVTERRQQENEVMSEQMKMPPCANFVRIEWRDLSFTLGKSKRSKKHILRNLDGHVEQGELVALMGESGSGKSTLLNVLGGRAGYGRISGAIMINSQPFKPVNLKHMIGFVLQEYVLYTELTVFENLVYSACMRASADEDAETRTQRCETVCQLLGLGEQRDFVLDKNIGVGRLSGGQMRRVGIGVEVVTNPAILLLDEPTSALDAVNTRIVVNILKMLSERGMCVVASIHQPRLSAYEAFTKMLLLSGGELFYGGRCTARKVSSTYYRHLGPADGAVEYFAKLGYVCPTRVNPADFVIEICFGFVESKKVMLDDLAGLWKREYHRLEADQRGKRDSTERPCTVDQWCEWLGSHERFGALDAEIGPKSHLFAAHDKHDGKDAKYESSDADVHAVASWASLHKLVDEWPLPPYNLPNVCEQFLMCFQRYMLKMLRRRKDLYSSHFTAIILSTIAGLIMGPEFTAADSITFMVVYIALFLTFIATNSIDVCTQGASNSLFEHEGCVGISQGAELFGRFIGHAVVSVLLAVVFCLPYHSLCNLSCPLGAMIALFWMLWWAASGLGYVVCVSLGRESATVIVAALALIVGVFLSTQLGPSLMEMPTLLAFSPARWAVQAFLLLVISYEPFSSARAQAELAMMRSGLLPLPPTNLLNMTRVEAKDYMYDFLSNAMETNRDAILEQMAICQGDTEEFIAQRGIYYDENPEDAPIDVPGRGFSRDRFAQPNDALGQLSDWYAEASCGVVREFDDSQLSGEQHWGLALVDVLRNCDEALEQLPANGWFGRCMAAMFIIGLVLRGITIVLFVYKYDGMPPWLRRLYKLFCKQKSPPKTCNVCERTPTVAEYNGIVGGSACEPGGLGITIEMTESVGEEPAPSSAPLAGSPPSHTYAGGAPSAIVLQMPSAHAAPATSRPLPLDGLEARSLPRKPTLRCVRQTSEKKNFALGECSGSSPSKATHPA